MTDIFGESTGYEDICNDYEFFEMEPTTVTTYKKKEGDV